MKIYTLTDNAFKVVCNSWGQYVLIESTGAPIVPPSDVILTVVNGTFVIVSWTVIDSVSGYEIVVNPVSTGGTPTTVKVRTVDKYILLNAAVHGHMPCAKLNV